MVDYEPCSTFVVGCSASNEAELARDGYLEDAVFGMLDVLLTARAVPNSQCSADDYGSGDPSYSRECHEFQVGWTGCGVQID
jgi:hypothetical protein